MQTGLKRQSNRTYTVHVKGAEYPSEIDHTSKARISDFEGKRDGIIAPQSFSLRAELGAKKRTSSINSKREASNESFNRKPTSILNQTLCKLMFGTHIQGQHNFASIVASQQKRCAPRNIRNPPFVHCAFYSKNNEVDSAINIPDLRYITIHNFLN